MNFTLVWLFVCSTCFSPLHHCRGFESELKRDLSLILRSNRSHRPLLKLAEDDWIGFKFVSY
jgi:hypothetical protein